MDPGPQRAGTPVDAGPLTTPGQPGAEEAAPDQSHANGAKVLNVHSSAYLDHGPVIPPKPPSPAEPPPEARAPAPPDDAIRLPHQEIAQTSGPPIGDVAPDDADLNDAALTDVASDQAGAAETAAESAAAEAATPDAPAEATASDTPAEATESDAAAREAASDAAVGAAGSDTAAAIADVDEDSPAARRRAHTETGIAHTAPSTAGKAGTAGTGIPGVDIVDTAHAADIEILLGSGTGADHRWRADDKPRAQPGEGPAESATSAPTPVPPPTTAAPPTAAATSPAIADPAAPGPSAGPAVADPVGPSSGPAVADPVGPGPGPAVAEPAAPGPGSVAQRPAAADPSGTDPSATDPSGTDPSATERAATGRPSVREPEQPLGLTHTSSPDLRESLTEIPMPPSYSSLAGGTVPGDPTATYGAMFTQRLRAMLPWPSAEHADPLGPLLRAHKMIHSGSDVTLLRRAYGIAEQMHRGQMRKSGEAFISHPLAVAEILADLGMDTTTLVAALLHDTVEDTSYTLGALERDFGSEVALLVDGVTKFDKVFYGADAEAETIRKMIVSAGRDVRVLVIKLADRLHNMRTLDARSRSSQVRIATATRDVLIPLCDRLGIQALKRELEDWVLRAINPSGYALVADYVKYRHGWNDHLAKVTAAVETELTRFKINATVTPRPRHLYSIWKDTVNGNFNDPYDLPRVVIIVDGPDTDCYAALGAVHSKWRPTPGRFKDFIASPKNNLYRSLHTTVLGPDGHTLEVLIRTETMHRSAEYGIVANFRYPEHAALFDDAEQADQLEWLRRLLDWETAAADPAQFIASLRCDLAEGQILVFTSTGRPILLPAEATPVDLAYVLGADIGNRCIGARLNGRLISVSAPLADGDTVEIVTRTGQRDEFDFDEDAPARGPSSEWLEFVKTPHARLHISRWFADREAPAVTIANKVRLGRLAIGLALRQRGRGLTSDLPLVRLLPRLDFPDLETLLVAVADHIRTADDVVDELIALVDHSPH